MSHTVTVKTRLDDEYGQKMRVVDTLTLVCTSSADDDCRRYPICDCEWWVWNEDKTADQHDHPRVSGRDCVIKDWFDAGGASYDGEGGDDMRDDNVPAIDRSGSITYDWADEYVTWDWADNS